MVNHRWIWPRLRFHLVSNAAQISNPYRSRWDRSLAEWESGLAEVKRWGARSQGRHDDLRSCPSWQRKGCGSAARLRPRGQSWTKATSWWTGRSLAADTWTDGQEGRMEGLGQRMDIMRGLDMQRSQCRGQDTLMLLLLGTVTTVTACFWTTKCSVSATGYGQLTFAHCKVCDGRPTPTQTKQNKKEDNWGTYTHIAAQLSSCLMGNILYNIYVCMDLILSRGRIIDVEAKCVYWPLNFWLSWTENPHLSLRGTDVSTFLRLFYDTFHRDRAVRQLLLTAFQYLRMRPASGWDKARRRRRRSWNSAPIFLQLLDMNQIWLSEQCQMRWSNPGWMLLGGLG